MKGLDTAQGTFSGLGAGIGNLDSTGDVIQPGAFANTLQDARQTKATKGLPYLWPLLFMHDEKMPCGGITDATETKDGLLIQCKCDLNTELGRMAFSGIREGYMNGLSIGYHAVRSTRDAKGNRQLLEIKLWEVSVITQGFQANPLAMADALSVKFRDDNGDWKHLRGMSLPPTQQRTVTEIPPRPDMPERATFVSPEEYKAAMTRYNRDAKAWEELVYHSAGLLTPLEQTQADSLAERKAALARQQDARATRSGASLEDVRGYYQRHGVLPDGRKLTPETIDVDAYYRDLDKRLSAAKGE